MASKTKKTAPEEPVADAGPLKVAIEFQPPAASLGRELTEVTPAMIEAGMEVARGGFAGGGRYILDDERLADIFRAMEKAAG